MFDFALASLNFLENGPCKCWEWKEQFCTGDKEHLESETKLDDKGSWRKNKSNWLCRMSGSALQRWHKGIDGRWSILFRGTSLKRFVACFITNYHSASAPNEIIHTRLLWTFWCFIPELRMSPTNAKGDFIRLSSSSRSTEEECLHPRSEAVGRVARTLYQWGLKC